MVMSSWSKSSGNRCWVKDSWVYSTSASVMKWSLDSQLVEEFFFGQEAQLLSGSARACYPRHQGSRRCKAAGRAGR